MPRAARAVASAVALAVVVGSCSSESAPPPYHPNSETQKALANAHPATRVDFVLKGALSAHLTRGRTFGDCGPSPANGDYSASILLDVNGAVYVLLIIISPFSQRAGRYSFPRMLLRPTAADPVVEATFGPFQIFADTMDQAQPPGGVVLDPDLMGGTLDASHIPTSKWWPLSGKQLSITGSWRC